MKAYARALSNLNPFAVIVYIVTCMAFGVVIFIIAAVSS